MPIQKKAMQNPTLICFGEVLWDILPTGKIAGGAPMNVAYHANNLGFSTKMISRIGNDPLGHALLHFLDEKGVSTQFVQTDQELPTGIVNVTLSPSGSPAYEIVNPSAWDNIQSDELMCDTVKETDVFVFGSLACRCAQTRNTLFNLLEGAMLRVLDANLRRPFYSKELLEELLSKADIAKMNDEELEIIADWKGVTGTEEEQMRAIKEFYQLELLILTKGDKGASCLDDADYCTHAGFSIPVADTIGSGDAFLAAFLKKLLSGDSTQECLNFACAIGALAATKQGGTPTITPEEIHFFMLSKNASNEK
jgi:fructokinase